MNRIKVHVGVVFTQAMFCDDNGRIYYHKVMTDVDKPWVSVVEAISELKHSFPEETFPWNHDVSSIDLQINFTNVHHSSDSIRKQLSCPKSEGEELKFCFETQESFYSLMSLVEQTNMEVLIRSNGILSLLRGSIALPYSRLGDQETELKEYFHQELGKLYEGDWHGGVFLWEELEQLQLNTS